MRSVLRRLTAVLPLALIIIVGSPVAAAADPPDPAAYRQAVFDAYEIVHAAAPSDLRTADRAAAILKAGTGLTQPEILADLNRRPPDFQDANTRLLALLDSLDHPASTTDPQQAQSRLRDIMAMHRYDALHQPPSLIDRLGQWIQDRIRDLLRLLFGSLGPGGLVPAWVVYGAGILVVAAVAVVVFRSTRGRLTAGIAVGRATGPRAPADYFAEADRLAAKGDRVGAIRALCAAVAATLAGERTWEGSPLTVREIFQRAPNPVLLRPLLLPFEAAVYGGRSVDADAYERAAQAAAQFRQPVERAA